jgi:NAD(P)-dependent dehydrogenase (short-subunit alcohol dehydrogenase family)
MPIRLDGQVALVTGAGRGLGRAFALDLARHGAHVVVNDLGGNLDGSGADTSVAQTVVDEIAELGGEGAADAHSVASYEGAYEMVKTAIDRWGRLDIVVSNAGFLRDRAVHNMTESDWGDVIATHLTGAYNILHHAWPVFRQQSYGRVVMTSSNSGFLGNFGQANYGAAKAGLIGLMNVLKIEGAKYNVMVNCLGPGASTRMTQSVMSPGRAASAMGPELVAPAVTYLCSPECTDSGLIIEASGGNFGRAAIVRNQRVVIADATADKIAEQWSAITNLDHPEVWWSVRQSLADYLKERDAAK